MAAPKRTPEQRELAIAYVVQEMAKGRPQSAIAADLGVARQQVGYDWQKALAKVREARTVGIQEWIDAAILKLELAMARCLECWQASMQATEEEEWIGDAPLPEKAESDSAEAEALLSVQAGHWRPKKRVAPKPSPSWPAAYNALLRTQAELLGVLKQREQNERQEQQQTDPIPRASEVTNLEEASRVLEKLEELSRGRLRFKRAG